MRELLLYTTFGCHLCDQAEQALAPVVDFINSSSGGNEEDRITIRLVEIADSTELMHRYGLRIPVIRLHKAEADLGWPFDQAQAFEFLSRQLP